MNKRPLPSCRPRHCLTLAALFLLSAAPAWAAKPLPRLPTGDAPEAAPSAWPPLPMAEEPAAQVPALPTSAPRGGLGALPTEPTDGGTGLSVDSSAPSGDEAERAVEWRIGQGRRPHKDNDLSLTFGVLPASIAGGVFWGIPLGHHGLINGVNDGFLLEFGALFLGTGLYDDARGSQFDILPAVGVRWDFYLTRVVSVFGTVKLGPRFGVRPRHRIFPDPIFALGTQLAVARFAKLRFELGYPQGFTVGVSVPFGPDER